MDLMTKEKAIEIVENGFVGYTPEECDQAKGWAISALIDYNVKDKASIIDDSISVSDCGAVGDGYTDDSQAFIKAVNSGASMVFIPSGTYNLNHIEISLPRKINFVGEYTSCPRLLDCNIVAPYGIVAENIIFNGGTARYVTEGGFPSNMQYKKVIIFATPRYDDASVEYENCIFTNTDIASLAFWSGNNKSGDPAIIAKPLEVSSAINCVFDEITNCGIWHSVNIKNAIYSGNSFRNFGDPTIDNGKVWGISLGDISNNTNHEASDVLIIDNEFDTFETAYDTDPNSVHVINANFIAVVCNKAVIRYNVFKDLIGYGHDREGIYTKGNDIEIAHNLIINGGSGEGYICTKPKAFKMWETRAMYIHDNTIRGKFGCGIMCYGTGIIKNNHISIDKVYRAIRGAASGKFPQSFTVDGNNINCGVGPISIDGTTISDYKPENLISCGFEYLDGIKINNNSISVSRDIDSTTETILQIIKIGNVVSDIEIKGNVTKEIIAGGAIQLTDTEVSSLNTDKNIMIDIEDNVFGVLSTSGIDSELKKNSHLKKTYVIRNNFIRSISNHKQTYGVIINGITGNDDVVYYESKQPRTAFTKAAHLYGIAGSVYSSLPSNYFSGTSSYYPSDFKKYILLSDIKSILSKSSNFDEFKSKISNL